MDKFSDSLHTIKLSDDGSFTAYSKEYDECYHSTKDGALSESYLKHIIPAYYLKKDKNELHILDICYGLGFNTLATILFYKKNAPDKKIFIYSPELDKELIKSLINFTYPKEFDELIHIIRELSLHSIYKDENLYIEIFLGDAREYIKRFDDKFDIVYQDAFSPSVNPILWTQEYFFDIKKSMKKDAILTTYSIAFKVRLALFNNGFKLYTNDGKNHRTSTIATLKEIKLYDEVDMKHKISCNKDIKPFLDGDI